MKARHIWNRLISEVKKSDIIIEVVDIRCIECTRNKKVERIALKEGKYLIVAVSKIDTIPSEYHKGIKQMLKRRLREEYVQANIDVLLFSYKERKGAIKMKKAIYEIKDKIGNDKDIKVFVVGYPNAGKSTLINLLTRDQKARHSPKPGMTRGVQWIKLKKGIMLVDSPGVIPADEGIDVLKGNFDPDKEESYEEAVKLLNILKKSAWTNLDEVLSLPLQRVKEMSGEYIIERYASEKRYLMRGGKVDLERAAKDIIRKWNRGELSALLIHPEYINNNS